MNEEFNDVLNDCLERLARGESIQQCIERYPEHEEELAPLLRIAKVTMQVVSSASYSSHAKARGLVRLNQAIAARKQRARATRMPFPILWPVLRPLMLGFAAVFLVLVAAGGTTVAASNSVPGEPLYWVKTTRENVELKIPRSDVARAKIHAQLANERGEEIQVLVAKGDFQHAEQVMARMQYHLGQSANHVGVVLPPDPVEMPAKPIVEVSSVQNALVIRQVLERDGVVLRSRMTELVQEAPPPEKRKIRRILHQSDLGYQLVIHALENDNPTAQGPFFRIDPFQTTAR